jgi:hypothetical protein
MDAHVTPPAADFQHFARNSHASGCSCRHDRKKCAGFIQIKRDSEGL